MRLETKSHTDSIKDFSTITKLETLKRKSQITEVYILKKTTEDKSEVKICADWIYSLE